MCSSGIAVTTTIYNHFFKWKQIIPRQLFQLRYFPLSLSLNLRHILHRWPTIRLFSAALRLDSFAFCNASDLASAASFSFNLFFVSAVILLVLLPLLLAAAAPFLCPNIKVVFSRFEEVVVCAVFAVAADAERLPPSLTSSQGPTSSQSWSSSFLLVASGDALWLPVVTTLRFRSWASV